MVATIFGCGFMLYLSMGLVLGHIGWWQRTDCSPYEEHPCIKNGYEVLQRGSFRTSPDTYWTDCLGLIFVAVVFNLLAYCFIRKYVRRSGYY
ncbi:hypothetical protein DOY81_013804 [Sarcophaga bullata]|nr:hypothetical protein DOY81_013804 [Sarcophaga bullata]